MARRKANIEMGFWRGGRFHPIRASDDYEPDTVGESHQYKPAKKKKAAKKKNSAHSRKMTFFRPRKRKAKANPVPATWTPAKVRTNAKGETQILFTGQEAKRVAKRNVEMGFWRDGIFHPIRASSDYVRQAAGEGTQHKTKKKSAKAKRKK